MAASDISLNELTGANPSESTDSFFSVYPYDFGYDCQDPVFSIQPQGYAQIVTFGFPTLVPEGVCSPPSIIVNVQFGEPYLAQAALGPVDPIISNVTPIGGNIGTQTPWGARLTLAPADGLISRIIMWVVYPTGTAEEVFSDNAFTPDYSGKSTIVQSSAGVFDISVIRNGGWPSSPRMFLHANTNRGGMTE